MELLDQILRAEFSYKSLTSKKESRGRFIRFQDRLTPNIPLQNFTFIKRIITLDQLREIVDSEKIRVLKENKEFISFVFDPYAPFSGEISELADFNFYCHQILTLDLKSSDNTFTNKNCKIVFKQHKEQLKKLYSTLNSSIINEKIHTNRWIDLKIKKRNLTTLVYEKENEFIGDCELFNFDKVIKLDDFEVLKDCRNKGIGEALLDSAISISKASGAETLYLITDRDEWVTEYYLSKGFELFAEYNSCILYS